MRNFLIASLSLVTLSVFSQGSNYQLVWSDEFDGNGAINSEKWFHQTQLPNGSSWYNGEIQHYTDREVNTFVSNGTLKLVAKKENFTDQGVTKEYTSARLNSKFAFTYGKVEILAKLPVGVGTWPAIWSLGKNIIEPGAYWTDDYGTVGWPACGEIDIMEHWGTNQNYVQSALHTPSSFGNTENLGGQSVSNVSDEFHLYAVEWTPEKMIFSVDSVEHYTYEPIDQNPDTWPFDADQYILLNVAIQSNIDPNFTQSEMEIDYVRVYQENATALSEMENAKSVHLFPNPVSETLTIQIPSEFVGEGVKIYSLLGEELHSFVLSQQGTLVDISYLPNGIYIVTFEDSTGIYPEMIFKI